MEATAGGYQMYQHAPYLKMAIQTDARKKTISKAIRRIRQWMKISKMKVEAIAFSGMSGALVAPSIADKLGLHLICVRKSTDKAHSSNSIEGWCSEQSFNYIIVDDLVSSSDTIKHIRGTIDYYSACHGICVGLYLYATEIRLINRQEIEADRFTLINTVKDYL